MSLTWIAREAGPPVLGLAKLPLPEHGLRRRNNQELALSAQQLRPVYLEMELVSLLLIARARGRSVLQAASKHPLEPGFRLSLRPEVEKYARPLLIALLELMRVH